VNDQAELRDRLHRLADATTRPPRADLPEALVGEGRRRRRRRRRALAGAAAAVAVAVAAVPAVLDRLPDTGVAAEQAAGPDPLGSLFPPPIAPVTDLPGADVYGGPARGSLADDAAFVAGLLQPPGAGPAVDEQEFPLAGRTVVYAGDVAGQRWALVTAATGDGATALVAWFTGPAGAAPAQLEPVSAPHLVARSEPAALLDPATGAVVVVAAPGDTVEVSARPEVTADGALVRTWEPAAVTDGVAVADVGARPGWWDSSVRLRVARGGQATQVLPQWLAVPGTEPAVQVASLRPSPIPAADDPLVRDQAGQVLAQAGLVPEQVTFTSLWAGDVLTGSIGTTRVSLLAATMPSGGVYLHAATSLRMTGSATTGSSTATTSCGSGALPAGRPIAERTVALLCGQTDLAPAHLLVAGPPQATTARLLAVGGAVLGEHPLQDGAAAVADAGAVATVEVLDAAGTVIGTTAPVAPQSLEIA
jgi:hypothetical protein